MEQPLRIHIFRLIQRFVVELKFFELKPLSSQDIQKALVNAIEDEERGLGKLDLDVTEEALNHLASSTNGDVRSALNALELAAKSTEASEDGKIHITIQIAEECIQRKALSYDKDGDQHYDVISALQKSIRGSDVNAALHYAARLMEAGDLTSLMRRLLVIAYEDIGLGIHKVPLALSQPCKLLNDLDTGRLEFHLQMR